MMVVVGVCWHLWRWRYTCFYRQLWTAVLGGDLLEVLCIVWHGSHCGRPCLVHTEHRWLSMMFSASAWMGSVVSILNRGRTMATVRGLN